jgi:hypothetical protein
MDKQTRIALGVRGQILLAIWLCMLVIAPAQATTKRWFCDSYRNTSPNSGLCPLCISACGLSNCWKPPNLEIRLGLNLKHIFYAGRHNCR